jgi:thiol-disulfide isomerase/thioredoxin
MSITSFIVKNTIKNIIYYIPVILIFAIGLYIYRQYNKPKEHFAQLSKQADFMMFYADWCPHCTHAKPEFKKVMDKLSSGELNGHKINVKMINAEENKELAKQFKVDGYPTLILKMDDKTYTYEGNRTEGDMMTYLETMLRY